MNKEQMVKILSSTEEDRISDLGVLSDHYKDIYGSRPDWSSIKDMTFEQIADAHKIYYTNGYKYVDPEEAHCRVVFFSKKAAATKFPEHRMIGEDTLHYFLLKHEAHLGNISMFTNDETPCTYIYDQTDGQNTIYQEMMVNKNWKWMETFNEDVQKYKDQGILHEEELPKVQIDYTEDYEIDSLGYSGLASFKANKNTTVLAPANASQDTILKLYKGELTIAMKNNS